MQILINSIAIMYVGHIQALKRIMQGIVYDQITIDADR